MNDNETNFGPVSEPENSENAAPVFESEEKAFESTDIYSEPNVSGEEINPAAKMEKSYEGYFKEGEESAYSDFNPYSESGNQQEAYNPYADAANKQENVKSEPVSGEKEQTPPPYNPYAAPQNSQQQSSYQQTPPFNQQNYSYNQPYYQQPGNMPPEKKGKGKKVALGIVATCIVIALIAIVSAFFGGDTPDVSSGNPDTSTTEAPTTIKPIVGTTQSSEALSQINSIVIAEKVRPSVVGVMTYKSGQLYGEGSGVLWAEDAGYTYVVTCAHVIDESGVTYGVMLLDGKTYEAEMVASDTRTDIGVLKIEATGLPLAEIGDSSALKIGEPIYAIGNPGGAEYFGSITDGIVSAIDRSVSATYTMTCIQHNAAINPGNSGGALVNTAGQIVGINSSKIASTEYEGMGFAVPTSIAVSVVDSLIQYKYVPNRPKLGIEYADVSAYQLYSLVVSIKGLPQGSLVIAGISSDSSLKNTEAQVGDLIIGVNGKDMDDSSVLLDLIDTGAVGDTLTLTLCRVESRTYKTTTFDVTITLVEDKGTSQQEEETTTQPYGGNDYYYGGAESFEDFFGDYFGFGW
ncbi:MAG: trypsin-like peptidase domain-containing protein [Clostridia bacterium]|nr:trypsin-like peptidase domain-containing protein [Clostridia bacterium]